MAPRAALHNSPETARPVQLAAKLAVPTITENEGNCRGKLEN
jgi:hypothetical protein